MSTHDKESQADKAVAERKAMEVIDKELQIQIINIRSDIEKQKDIVSELKESAEFLMTLSPQQWVDQIKKERSKALEVFKKQWVREHKDDHRNDYVIFSTTDPIIFSA